MPDELRTPSERISHHPCIRVPESHLFVTEGEKTEPLYLTGLIRELEKRVNLSLEGRFKIQGGAENTSLLLQKAERHLATSLDEFRHVWLFFDLDDFPRDRFDNTVRRCQALNAANPTGALGPIFHPIWSNQSFEVWYLLHFQFFDTNISRKDYTSKLSSHLNSRGLRRRYEKADPDMFSLLLPSLPTAVRNARRLASLRRNLPPSQSRPGTEVYRLFDYEMFGQYFLSPEE